MLSTILFTPNAVSAEAISQVLEDAGVLRVVVRASPVQTAHELVRLCRTHDPNLILLDANHIQDACYVGRHLRGAQQLQAAIIGFRPSWTVAEQQALAESGVQYLVKEPFHWSDIEPTIYDAVHNRYSIDNNKLLAFLPAKAGSGCSSVALNTAGALAGIGGKKILLVDGDRRSGIISILLNLVKRNGLVEALRNSGELTAVEWEQHVVRTLGMDFLLADPAGKALLPTWGDYYLLLKFLESQYDYVVVDLPELVNPATAEVVRSAGRVFVVCTPEIPSLRLAEQRCRELVSWGLPDGNIHVLVNRMTRDGLSIESIQRLVGRPVFASVPNDYAAVHESVLASRLADVDSAFARGCQNLARKAVGLQPIEQPSARFAFLRAFSLAS